jgi:transcriptional regulator with XRE-family HTH domain
VIETTFSVLSPRLLLDEIATAFTVPHPSRYGRRRAVLHRIDAMTDLVDAVLAAEIDDATPLSVELGWIPAPAPAAPIGDDPDERLREQALAAVDDIRSTLGLSETAVAGIVGIARNTLTSWRRNQRVPYPATVRTLFEVQSLIAAATELLGGPQASRSWFHSPGTEGLTRCEMLAKGTGAIAAELRRALFRQPASILPSGDELEDVTATVAMPGSYTPEVFFGPVTVEPPLA